MLANFSSVLVFMVMALIFLGIAMVLWRLLRARGTYSEVKYTTYECGEGWL